METTPAGPTAGFWNSLTTVEAKCLKDLLDAAALFQLELEQNEEFLRESKEILAAREATCDRLRRNAQRSVAAQARAAEGTALAQRELRRLQEASFDDQNETLDLEDLQQRRGEVEREEALVESELNEQKILVQDLRKQLLLAKENCHQRHQNFEEMRERCLQEKLKMKQIHAEDLTLVQKETNVALQKLEVKDVELANLAQEFQEEVHALRSAESLAQQRQEEHQQQRDEAQEELAARLQEGNSLRDFCRKTHEEVVELSSRLRVVNDQAEEPAESTDSEVEWQLNELQQRCHTLERQCAHAQAAASRKPYAKLADLSFGASEAN
eukprot:symbB.v1.2.031556.t1/scaffold3676.1/size52183/2